MRWVALLIAIALGLVEPQPSTGRVTVIATDSPDARIPGIPGTLITLRSADSDRTAVTGGDGRATFRGLPPGRYAAIASLYGLYSQPHTGIRVSPGRTTTVTIELVSDCMELAPEVDGGLAWASQEADVIAHIRIPETNDAGACALANHCTCTLHRPAIVRLLKGQPPLDLRFIQEDAGYTGAEQVYAPGDEFIAFLKRDDTNHVFARMAGPRYMFRVRDGRVDGITIADFEKKIAALAAQPRGGVIRGTTVDANGVRLPGTSVMVRANGMERTAISDADGEFVIPGLPPGRYAVVPRLLGFEAVAPRDVSVRAGAASTTRLVLRPGCLEHIDYVDGGMTWALRTADAIVHIRVNDVGVVGRCAAEPYCQCTPHIAQTISVIKGDVPAVIHLVQEEPARAGDEFVAFLLVDRKSGRSHRLGPAYMFPVRDGRVRFKRNDAPGLRDGMTIDEFQKALRAITR